MARSRTGAELLRAAEVAAGPSVGAVGAVAAVDDVRSVAAAPPVVAGPEAEAVVAAEAEHGVVAAARAGAVRRRLFTPSSRDAGTVIGSPEAAGSRP